MRFFVCLPGRRAVCGLFFHNGGMIMSAFILTDKHFSAIANYCSAMHEGINPQAMADRLKRVNIESVNYRYSEKNRITRCKLQTVPGLTPYDIARLFACWNYQSCENGASIDFILLNCFIDQLLGEQVQTLAHDQSKLWTI